MYPDNSRHLAERLEEIAARVLPISLDEEFDDFNLAAEDANSDDSLDQYILPPGQQNLLVPYVVHFLEHEYGVPQPENEIEYAVDYLETEFIGDFVCPMVDEFNSDFVDSEDDYDNGHNEDDDEEDANVWDSDDNNDVFSNEDDEGNNEDVDDESDEDDTDDEEDDEDVDEEDDEDVDEEDDEDVDEEDDEDEEDEDVDEEDEEDEDDEEDIDENVKNDEDEKEDQDNEKEPPPKVPRLN